jgi:signal peptidase I
MAMLLITLLAPLMSVASLVTSVFSARFLATPLTVTTPSMVPTLGTAQK